jgi:hypothetical protein
MPRKDTTVDGVIYSAERLNNSVNGNPRYRLVMDLGDDVLETYVTMSDASAGYNVQNLYARRDRVRLTLTPAGRVRYIETL